MGKRSVKRVFGKKTVRRYIENMTIGIRSMMTILTTIVRCAWYLICAVHAVYVASLDNSGMKDVGAAAIWSTLLLLGNSLLGYRYFVKPAVKPSSPDSPIMLGFWLGYQAMLSPTFLILSVFFFSFSELFEEDDDVHSAGGALGAFFFILAIFLAGFWILVVSLKKAQPEPSAGAYYWPHRYGGSSAESSPKRYRTSSNNSSSSSSSSSSNNRRRPWRSRREEKRARAALPPIPDSYRESQRMRSDDDFYRHPGNESAREDFFYETLTRRQPNDSRRPWDDSESLYHAPDAADVMSGGFSQMQEQDEPEVLHRPPQSARSRNDGYDLSEHFEEGRTEDEGAGDGSSRLQFVAKDFTAPEPISHGVHANVNASAGSHASNDCAAASQGRVTKPAPWMTARAVPQSPKATSRASNDRGEEEDEGTRRFEDKGDVLPPPPPPAVAQSQLSPRWIRQPKGTSVGVSSAAAVTVPGSGSRSNPLRGASNQSNQLSPASLVSKGSSSSAKGSKKSAQQPAQRQQAHQEQTPTGQVSSGPPARSAAAFRWG